MSSPTVRRASGVSANTLLHRPGLPVCLLGRSRRAVAAWHCGDQLVWRDADDRAHPRAGRGREARGRRAGSCSGQLMGCRSTPPYPRPASSEPACRAVVVKRGLNGSQGARSRLFLAALRGCGSMLRRPARRSRPDRRGGARRRASTPPCSPSGARATPSGTPCRPTSKRPVLRLRPPGRSTTSSEARAPSAATPPRAMSWRAPPAAPSSAFRASIPSRSTRPPSRTSRRHSSGSPSRRRPRRCSSGPVSRWRRRRSLRSCSEASRQPMRCSSKSHGRKRPARISTGHSTRRGTPPDHAHSLISSMVIAHGFGPPAATADV